MAMAIAGLFEPFERLARARRAEPRRPWPLNDVYEFTIEHIRISPAAIHRRLRMPTRVGEKCLAQLEREGVVGPREGLGSREVLVHE